MGKIRIKTLGVDAIEKKQKLEAKKRKEAKASKLEAAEVVVEKEVEAVAPVQVNIDMLPEEPAAVVESEEEIQEEVVSEKKAKKVKEATKNHGKKYVAAKKHVEKKAYDLKSAIKILKKLPYAKFDESVEMHVSLTDNGIKGEVTLPHGTGKDVRVAIVDDALLEALESGKVDFDILLTTPSYMPKLAKFAKVLGPKGLMPNPKLGTITENPAEAMKKFKAGAVRFKAEAKFPLMHQVVGKMSFEDEQLTANIKELIKAVGLSKIKSAYIAGSMTPSVELDISSL